MATINKSHVLQLLFDLTSCYCVRFKSANQESCSFLQRRSSTCRGGIFICTHTIRCYLAQEPQETHSMTFASSSSSVQSVYSYTYSKHYLTHQLSVWTVSCP